MTQTYQRPLPIVSDCRSEGRESPLVLAPAFRGVTPNLADLMALLPIRAVNQRILAETAVGIPPGFHVIAAVLCVDPFINGEVLYRSLAEHGVAGVINLPSVAIADDQMKKALEVARLSVEEELASLAAARRFGLTPTAVIFSHVDALRATALGIETFVLHPGLPTGDERIDRRVVDGVEATLDRLLRQGLETILYKHPGFAPLLDGAAARAPQLLTWGLPSG